MVIESEFKGHIFERTKTKLVRKQKDKEQEQKIDREEGKEPVLKVVSPEDTKKNTFKQEIN